MVDFLRVNGRPDPTTDPLQPLISAETCHEILQALQTDELLIAFCRVHRLPDAVPACILGVPAAHLSRIMMSARLRLAAEIPELAVLLAGRRRGLPTSAPPAPPESEFAF